MRRLIALVALIAAGMLALSGRADAPVTRVDITSQPSGATLIVDGKDRGTTPITLFDLKPGLHHLKCRLTGYQERDRIFKLEEGQPLQRNVVFEPEKGLLLLKSEPEGCNIVIGGISIGQTPRLITDLDAKDTHRITLRKAGYRPSVFEVKFNGRAPQVRTETLILDSGTLNVTSEPAGAEVTVNGIVRGKTPLKVKDIPKGLATVRLKLDGFKEEVRELSMNAGDRQTLALALKGLPGTLYLSSVPNGARFYVNGEFIGKDPVVMPNLAPGDYQVKAELEGYGTLGRVVKIGNGESPREEFRLSNVMGRLEVRSAPPGAQVLLDGRVLGTTKSKDPKAEASDIFPIENVMEGEHTLIIRREGFKEITRHPKVQSTKTTGVNVRLTRVFTPDIEISTDAGSYKGVLIKNSPDYITIEIKMGVLRSFPRADIRKVQFLQGLKK